ncbi:MAG: DUF1330 domain-containing protein [Polyangiales bacterium]
MPTVNPTDAQIEDFERHTPDDKAIVMVNLLRFRERAEPVAGGEGGSGREAYSRYSKAVVPLLWEVGGQVLWMGRVRAGVIVPADESWDEVLLVHYPSRNAFLRMVKSDAYQAIMPNRTAALADSRLIETRAAFVPRWLLGAARGLLRVKTIVWPKIER